MTTGQSAHGWFKEIIVKINDMICYIGLLDKSIISFFEQNLMAWKLKEKY